MQRSKLVSVHTWASFGIIWFYMFSVHVYKIWYIATAIVVYISLLFVISRILRIRGLVTESVGLLLYFSYLAVTTLWSLYPDETLKGVLIDSIFFVVFVVSYLAVLNSTDRKIISAFLTLPIIGLISTFVFYDPENIRIGDYVYLVLPVTIPFIALSILTARGMRLVLSLLGFLIALGVTSVSMSRTSLAATIGCTLLSFVLLSQKKLYSRNRMTALSLLTLILICTFLAFPVTRNPTINSISRIHDTFLNYVRSDLVGSNIQDRARNELTQHVIELIPEYAISGMGYRNYEKYSENQYGRARNLHSIYHIWLLEGGIPLVIIASVILIRYYYRIVKLIQKTGDENQKSMGKAYLIAMTLTLIIGLFHQVIQAPMFFLLLGGGLALTHREIYRKNFYVTPIQKYDNLGTKAV